MLLFTQMSRMLDVFEVFLNLHAHTYQRLDGSTSVDLRQRLMVKKKKITKNKKGRVNIRQEGVLNAHTTTFLLNSQLSIFFESFF